MPVRGLVEHLMLFSKDAPKARRFRIWSICLLVLVVSASIVFVTRVSKQSSEPFVAVSFFRTNIYGTQEVLIQVSNRMSFSVDCNLLAENYVQVSGHLFMEQYFSIAAHSKDTNFLVPWEPTKVSVRYERQLKPIEISVLNRLPWLKQHYLFRRHGFFTIYGPVPDKPYAP